MAAWTCRLASPGRLLLCDCCLFRGNRRRPVKACSGPAVACDAFVWTCGTLISVWLGLCGSRLYPARVPGWGPARGRSLVAAAPHAFLPASEAHASARLLLNAGLTLPESVCSDLTRASTAPAICPGALRRAGAWPQRRVVGLPRGLLWGRERVCCPSPWAYGACILVVAR